MYQQEENGLPCDRIVGFLDILGFSAIIDDITKHPNESMYKYRLIERVLNEKSRRIERNRERYSIEAMQRDGGIRPSMEGALFSDSIVVSSPINQKVGFSENVIVEEIADMASYLLAEGIFVRGGIAKGWCYHNQSIIFGKGMIHACNLEKTSANVPRIVVADEIVRDMKSYSELYADMIFNRDTDGLWFVNIFNYFFGWLEFEPDYFEYDQVNQIRTYIIKGLEDPNNSEYNINAKYRWMATQFNLSIDRYEEYNVSRYGINKINF